MADRSPPAPGRQRYGVALDPLYTHPLVLAAVDEWLTGDGLRIFVLDVYTVNFRALRSFHPQETVRDALVRLIQEEIATHGLNRYSDFDRIADAALRPLFPPQIDPRRRTLAFSLESAIRRKLRDSDEFRAALEYALARPDAELYAAFPSGSSDEDDDDDEQLRDRIGEDVMNMLMAGGLPAVATSFVSRASGARRVSPPGRWCRRSPRWWSIRRRRRGRSRRRFRSLRCRRRRALAAGRRCGRRRRRPSGSPAASPRMPRSGWL